MFLSPFYVSGATSSSAHGSQSKNTKRKRSRLFSAFPKKKVEKGFIHVHVNGEAETRFL